MFTLFIKWGTIKNFISHIGWVYAVYVSTSYGYLLCRLPDLVSMFILVLHFEERVTNESSQLYVQPLSLSSETESVKKKKHLFPGLTNIYLSWDIQSWNFMDRSSI
jgi:hypothetical protein